MHTNTISSMCSKSLQIEGINVQRQLLIELRISFHRYDTRKIFMYHISDKIRSTHEMDPWLNYASICAICGERGFTDFGPYRGLLAEEMEEAIEEIVAEERRRRRQLRSRRFRNRKN